MSAPHILVVDDEPDIRALVQEILEDEGFLVAIAENGESARHALRDRRSDLILLDIVMPGIGGIHSTRQILIAFPSIKVIAMSLHDDRHFVAAMRAAGAALPVTAELLLIHAWQGNIKPNAIDREHQERE